MWRANTDRLELYSWTAPGSEAHVPVDQEDIPVPSPYFHRLEKTLPVNIGLENRAMKGSNICMC